MVNSVSGTPTGGNVTSTTPLTKSDLSDPGSYSSDLNAGIPQSERKQGSAIGFLAKLLIGAAVTGGAMVLARKHIKFLQGEFKPKGIVDTAKHYFAKAADAISENTTKAWTYVKGLFNQKTKTTITDKSEMPPPRPEKGKVPEESKPKSKGKEKKTA